MIQKKLTTVSIIIAMVSIAFVQHAKAASIPLNDPDIAQWAYEDTGAYDAWKLTKGSREVVVAIIDNGFDTFHPDLRDNVWKNEGEIPNNDIDDDSNGYVDDVYGWSFIEEDKNNDGTIDTKERLGHNDPRPTVSILSDIEKEVGTFHHGTVVAGIIGAVGDNSLDGSGISPQVRLMNLQVVDETGNGTFDRLGEAIRYAVDNGAHIINLSLIGESHKDMLAAVEYAYEHGVSVIAAAGNNSISLDDSPLYPICADADKDIEQVLGVSAIQESHHRTVFSNLGATCIDITAPGTNISSTVRFSPSNGLTERFTGGWNGTSFAAPLVSGAAALIQAIHPSWGPAEIFKAIISTVHHTPSDDEVTYAKVFGAGLLQIDKAIAYALERIERAHTFGTLVVLSPTSGHVWERDTKTSRIVVRDILKGADAVAHGKAHIAVVTNISARQVITVYDLSWNEVSTFTIPSSGPVDLAFMQFDEDDQPELVITPQYADDQVLRVLELDGEERGQYSIDGVHQGVSLATGQHGNNDIATVFFSWDGMLHVYTFIQGNMTPVEQFSPGSIASRGDIALGDVDGDGGLEVVLGSRVGDRPLIALYEQNGTFQKAFTVYDGYTRGFSLESADYDGDKTDDIIVIPHDAGAPVRVWNHKTRKIAQWQLDTFGASSPYLSYIVVE